MLKSQTLKEIKILNWLQYRYVFRGDHRPAKNPLRYLGYSLFIGVFIHLLGHIRTGDIEIRGYIDSLAFILVTAGSWLFQYQSRPAFDSYIYASRKSRIIYGAYSMFATITIMINLLGIISFAIEKLILKTQ